MKAIVLMAAVVTSALLTVPTVTQAADAKVSELRLNACGGGLMKQNQFLEPIAGAAPVEGYRPAIDLTRSA